MDAPERRAPDLFKPTLVAGIAFGVAAGLPGTSLLNLCLCAPAWGAGLGAAFLHGRACREAGLPLRPAPFPPPARSPPTTPPRPQWRC